MQRHFSNRGEPLAEVTAARMQASRKTAKSGMVREGRRALAAEWFPHPAEPLSRPKKKLSKAITDGTAFL